MALPHTAVGSCGNALDTAHAVGPSFGQDVVQPIGHEHVTWDVHPARGEIDTQGFGDGVLSGMDGGWQC